MGKHKCCSSVLRWRREQVTSRQWRPTSVTLKKEHAQQLLCSDGKQIMSKKKKTTSNCEFNEILALVAKSSCTGIIYLDPAGCNPAVDQRLLLPGGRRGFALGAGLCWSSWAGIDPCHVLHAFLLASALLVGSELRNTRVGSCGGSDPYPQPCPCPVPGWQISVSLLLVSTVFNELI